MPEIHVDARPRLTVPEERPAVGERKADEDVEAAFGGLPEWTVRRGSAAENKIVAFQAQAPDERTRQAVSAAVARFERNDASSLTSARWLPFMRKCRDEALGLPTWVRKKVTAQGEEMTICSGAALMHPPW